MLRTFRLTLMVILFITGFLPASSTAAQPLVASGQPPQALCLPGVYLQADPGCSPLGPSQYITRMAQVGMTLPLQPLSYTPIDPMLGYVDYQYAELMENRNVPIYPTLEDAKERKNQANSIAPGVMGYISYYNRVEEGGEVYYELRDGGWIPASQGIKQRVSIPRSFNGGVEFTRTPRTSFGWVIPTEATIESKHTPGFGVEDNTGRLYNAYDIVPVYATEKVADEEWYLIGPDEWVLGRRVGRVIPNPNPPEGVTNGRWIEVNLYEQTLAAYDNSQLVYATVIATGLEPFWTRPGLFPIYKKLESTPMSGSFEADRSDYYMLQDVPFTMYYDDARALHGAYWRHRLGFPQSHGCVNLSIADAHWLFNWAQMGDMVYVWDPSGETPTDPSFYRGGGAP